MPLFAKLPNRFILKMEGHKRRRIFSVEQPAYCFSVSDPFNIVDFELMYMCEVSFDDGKEPC